MKKKIEFIKLYVWYFRHSASIQIVKISEQMKQNGDNIIYYIKKVKNKQKSSYPYSP